MAILNFPDPSLSPYQENGFTYEWDGEKWNIVGVPDGDGSADYILPIASDVRLGGIRVGDNLSISGEGILSVTGVPGSGGGSFDGSLQAVTDIGNHTTNSVEIGGAPGSALTTIGAGTVTTSESVVVLGTDSAVVSLTSFGSGDNTSGSLGFSVNGSGGGNPLITSPNFSVNVDGTVKVGGTLPAAPNVSLDEDGSAIFAGGNGNTTNNSLGINSLGLLSIRKDTGTDTAINVYSGGQTANDITFVLNAKGDAGFAGTLQAANLTDGSTTKSMTDVLAGSASANTLQEVTDAGNQTDNDILIGDRDPSATDKRGVRLGMDTNQGGCYVQALASADAPTYMAFQALHGDSEKFVVNYDGSATFAGNVSTSTLDVYRADGTTPVLSCSSAGNVAIGQNSTIIANDQGIAINTDKINLNAADGSAKFAGDIDIGDQQYQNPGNGGIYLAALGTGAGTIHSYKDNVYSAGDGNDSNSFLRCWSAPDDDTIKTEKIGFRTDGSASFDGRIDSGVYGIPSSKGRVQTFCGGQTADPTTWQAFVGFYNDAPRSWIRADGQIRISDVNAADNPKITLEPAGGAAFAAGGVKISDGLPSGEGKVEIYRSPVDARDLLTMGKATNDIRFLFQSDGTFALSGTHFGSINEANVQIQGDGSGSFVGTVTASQLVADASGGQVMSAYNLVTSSTNVNHGLFIGSADTNASTAANSSASILGDGSAEFAGLVKVGDFDSVHGTGTGTFVNPSGALGVRPADATTDNVLSVIPTTTGVATCAITAAGAAGFAGTITSDQADTTGHFFQGHAAGNTLFEVQSDGQMALRKTSGSAAIVLKAADGNATFTGSVSCGDSAGSNTDGFYSWVNNDTIHRPSIYAKNLNDAGYIFTGNKSDDTTTSSIQADGEARFGGGLDLTFVPQSGGYEQRISYVNSAGLDGCYWASKSPQNMYVMTGTGGSTGGVVLFSGGTGWNDIASNARLKDVLDHDQSTSWDTIRSLDLKQYYWKTQTTQERSAAVPYLGPIVEDLEAIDPNLVITTGTDEEGLPTQTYNKPLLEMKAIDALSMALKRIEALEAEVAELKAGT